MIGRLYVKYIKTPLPRWLRHKFVQITILSSCVSCGSYQTLKQVNWEMNKVPYISDLEQFGKINHQTTMQEFIKNGGDCEDYAISKYIKLITLGYNRDDMKVLMLFNDDATGSHTVLVIKDQGASYILDNKTDELLGVESISGFDFNIEYPNNPLEEIVKNSLEMYYVKKGT